MIRIGRKTYVTRSVINCNGYDVYIYCSCWTVEKDGVYVDKGGLYELESILKWCMEN